MTLPDAVTQSQRSWRPNRWSARTRLATVLVGVALLSMLVIGIFNYGRSRQLLNDTAVTHLVDIGSSRANRIEAGLAEVQELVTNMAADTGVIDALTQFSTAFTALDETLDSAELDALTTAYEEAIREGAPPGVPVPAASDLVPATDSGRYLQYHYIAKTGLAADQRSEIDDAGDGSGYSAVHARYHPTLRATADAGSLDDVLLIDAATSDIVYSVEKRVDFATNLGLGPYRASGLATAVLDRLNAAAAGEAVLVDFSPYIPGGGNATLFAAAAIRRDGRVIGAVAADIPAERLTNLTTAGQDWEGTGLGETGEIYVVGSDLLMRSESRLWLEDPQTYQEAAGAAGYGSDITDAVEAFDTTVLIQPVNTPAVEAALRGDVFTDRDTVNYLDQSTLTVAAPLEVPGVEWVMVADVSTEEAFAPLRDALRQSLITAAILFVVVALVGGVLAGLLLRPVKPIKSAVEQVGAGHLDVALAEAGRDEFSELGKRFNDLVEAMREQQAQLALADAEITELLAAVVPSRFVAQIKEGDREVAEAVKNVTVIAVSIETRDEISPAEMDDAADILVRLLADIEDLATEHRLEHLHASASEQLFAAGLRSPERESATALAFAVDARQLTARFGEEHGIAYGFRAGLAAGDVIGGVVGSERMAFEIWGPPPRLALALAGVAATGEILVDASVASEVRERWPLDEVTGLTDLGGAQLEGWAVRSNGSRDALVEPSRVTP